MVKRIVSIVPNTITCCNLVAGTLAVIAAFQGPVKTGVLGLTGFELAWLMITAAAAFDFFDGFSARALHAYSPLGKELDSLADLVSFGVAPGMIIFNLFHYLNSPSWVPYLSLVIPVCGALRLARFNIDDRQTSSFIGLPIPANAIFWIGFSAWLVDCSARGPVEGERLWLSVALVPVVALSMVCNLHMFSLKFKNLKIRDNALRFIQIIATFLLIAIIGVPGAALSIALYFILSVIDNRLSGR